MTRVVAGEWSGRRLTVPRDGVRPTSQRVREAMFSTIDASLRRAERSWSSLVVLDLFAGSGALGIEALSRGAGNAIFVERNRQVARQLRNTLVQLAAQSRATVLVGDARYPAGLLPDTAVDLVFADPPYDLAADLLAATLGELAVGQRLRPDALLVVETARRTQWQWPTGFIGTDQRRYGDTAVWYGRRVDRP